MRKLFLCVMLAVMIFTVGIASAAEVPANPFSSFGLFTDYVTSGSVKLNASGTPDYSGVSSFVANEVRLGGMLKPDAERSSLPFGTVTVLSGDGAGRHYQLAPGGSSSGSSFVRYSTNYSYYDSNGVYHYGEFPSGSRVMWNIYTSPDVIAGAADIKSTSTVKIGRNDIVPYVKYTPLSGNNSGRAKFDVYFVRSGDWAAPVAVDYDYVSVNGSIVPDFSSPYPVRHSFTGYYIYYSTTYTVTYGKGNTAYTWRFSIPDSIIDWGKLSLDLQPFTLKAGDTETVTVKIPSRYNLSEDVLMSSDVLTVGNSSVLDAEIVSFTQGKGWSGNTEDKSRLELLLTGIAPGRTVLRISIPNVRTYYREIHVTDASGDMNITEGTTSFKPVITHETQARYVEGRPYYPSAEDDEIRITALAGFTGAVQRTGSRVDASGDIQEYTYYTGPGGYIGADEGARHHIHTLRLDSNTGEKYSVVDSGMSYTTNSSDRYYNSEYPGYFSFSLDDFDDINIWMEFPDSPDMNLSSAKLSSLISRDNIRTTARQLETFAPYFELHHASNDLYTTTSLDWSFVNPSTMKPVTPSGVTDITVNGQSVSGTSGTVSFNYYGSSINIQYSYGGNVYVWYFSLMSEGSDSRFRVPNVETGKTVSVDTSITVNSGEIYIWDRDILSADPAVFTSADTVSFRVKRLKDGHTSLSLIFPYSESSSPYYRYRAYRTTTTAREIAPSSQRELSAKFIVPSSRIPIVEGKPYYGESGVSFQSSAEILLECKEPITLSEYINIRDNLTGTLYVSYDVPIYNASGDVVSHDTVEDSDTLYPSGNSYYSGGGLYVTLSYNSMGWSLLRPGRTVRWEFPSGLIKSGRAKIPEFDTRKAANLIPNLILHREGLNAERLEWTFTDSKDNPVTAPSNVALNVYNSRGTISSDKGTGSIAVNLPEVLINEISVSYELDGLIYRFDFRPVDQPEYSDSARITWNATSHDLPLAMRKGETRAVTLSVSGDYGNITPLIGNPDIVSMSVLSSTDSTVTVRLTAKESGMTTLGTMYHYKWTETYYVYESPDIPPTPVTRVYYGSANYIAWPREIWVSELDTSTGKYRVPHLTDDVDALMESLKPGNASSWTEYGTVSPDKAGTVTDEPEYDESTKDVGYDGLSVYPRFAMPKDPSADAYSAVWDFVDGLNLPYGVDMFNDDNMRVIASRDAAEVWKAMKDELLSADVPQLVAIVLPEIYIYEPGFYVFRLPADNITGNNQAIFWSAERSGDVYSMYHRSYYVTSADLDRQIFIDDSGNLTGAVSGDEYISVAAYFADGVYRPVITAAATSHDLEILRGLPAEPSPDVRPTSPDVRPTSPDVRPTSPDVTPNPARPTKPGINVQDKASSLRDIFSRPGSIVAELPESSAGASRTVSDLPASQLTAITEQGREVAVVLPEITVETAAIYVFGVSLDNLTPGDTIFLDMTLTSVSAGSVNASANYEGDYAFLDDDGNEVYTVPANRHVNVAAYLEPNYVYSPAITTSGNSSEGDNVIGLASSSGGCSAGFGGVILLAGLALISRKKH